MKDYKLSIKYKYGIDYKTRNFIFFAVILVLTVAFFIYQINKLNSENQLLKQEQQKLSNEFSVISAQLSSLEDLEEQLRDLEYQYSSQDKTLPSANTTASTLAYMFQVFDKYILNIHFNYNYLGRGVFSEADKIYFNRYSIEGRAFINEFYVFLDQLERQSLVYTIESISINSLSASERGKLFFKINLNAYYSENGVALDDIPLNDLKEMRLPNNIFYQRIHDTIEFADGRHQHLVDIKDLSFIGLTKFSVFYHDKANDSYGVLKRGDSVKYGYLNQILWEQSEVVFRVRPHGIWESHRFKVIQK